MRHVIVECSGGVVQDCHQPDDVVTIVVDHNETGRCLDLDRELVRELEEVTLSEDAEVAGAVLATVPLQ